MYKITSEEIAQEILNRYIPENIQLRTKLIRKINEMYQYNAEVYNKASLGDYSFIEPLLQSHIFHYC